MVVSKRKIATENERYTGFDSVIEIDDVKAKSFGAAQTAAAGTLTYTTRKETVAPPKTSDEAMPKIQRKEQAATQVKTKQALTFKTKVLLTAYLAMAVVLAAVVIATGVAVANATKEISGIEGALNAQISLVNEQTARLEYLDDPIVNTGRAVEQGMEKIDNVTTITLLDYSEPASYTASTNGFDKIGDFISKIFGKK